MTWRDRILSWLRVPDAPAAPAGDGGVSVFRAAPNFYRYQVFKLVLRNIGAFAGLLLALRFSSGFTDQFVPARLASIAVLVNSLIALIETGAVVGFIAQAIGSFMLARLDFEQRWYILSDRSVRTREGLIRLHERTMTLANIQNVSIRQGPIQRLLGIADVEIRSAGGASPKPGEKEKVDSHVAYFHGIDNAQVVRDLIRDRLRQYRDAGLGDPDDNAITVDDNAITAGSNAIAAGSRSVLSDSDDGLTSPDAPPLLAAAREFAAEARRLRECALSDRL